MAASELSEIPLREELIDKETHIEVVEHIEHDVEYGVRLNYDPYPKRTISDLLCRKYLIYQDTNFSTSAFIRPFDELLDVPQIARCLQGFKYFRSDLNVEILVTANKNVYGTILVSTLPFIDPTDNTRSDITRQLQAEPHLLDISRQEGLTLRLPFVNLTRYLDLDAQQAFKQWRLQVSVVAVDSLVVDVVPSVELEVWANFEQPETALYTDAVFQSRTVSRHSNPYVNMAGVVNALGQYIPSMSNILTRASSPAVAAAAASTASASTLAYQAMRMGSKAIEALEPKGPSQHVKSQVCPDLNGTSATVLDFLGDPVRGAKKDLPSVRNVYDLETILSTPAYLDTYVLSTVEDDFTIDCDPDLPGSYFNYLLRMFKYYHTDTKIMIRFSTAPDVTAKVALKVLPSGLASDHYGDLPFWEISMKGTTDFCCTIPYLENSHWLETYDKPQAKLHVSLMRDIPKVYDKVPKIFAHVFLAPVNTAVASLQSPCNPTAQATFSEAFAEVHSFGSSYRSEFLHSYSNVFELLARYSTRDVDSSLPIYPYPHVINSEMYKYDTFDYVAQLYMFYSGSMDVKYLCEGVAPETLKMVVGNSNGGTPHGNSFRAGNSMAMTSQSVWPVIEINFPFEQVVEFNSLKDPLPTYVPEINLPDSITEVFLRPGPDFSFFTLAPTPDWADDVSAVFQSGVSRLVGHKIYSGRLLSANGASSSRILNSFPSGTCTVVLEGYMVRISGSTDCNSSISIAGSTYVPDIYNALEASVLGTLIPWVDVTNSGKNYSRFSVKRVLSEYPASPWFVRFMTDNGSATFEAYYTITCIPFYTSVLPISPDSGNCDVLLSANQTVSVSGQVEVMAAAPLDVNISGSSMTTPLGVHDSGIVPVSLVDINTTDTLNVTGTMSVSNAPLWVTNYRP